jgi:hypothetical protein
MKTRHKFVNRGTVALLAASGVLSACLGDGGSSSVAVAPTAEVPAAASQSSAGFISYLEALIASPADTLEPVDTSTVMAPTDDTSEPVPIGI